MKTLDPVEHDVIEGRVADLATTATPADIGVAAVYGRMAPAAFRCRRQVDTERSQEAPTVACFELGANQLVYVNAPSTPQRAPDACRKGLQASFKLLQNKQREVIWQLKSDVSP
jgi:hypothetical protein